MTYEEVLMKKIQTGSLNDKEIDEILSHGDRDLKNALELRVEELERDKSHIHRVRVS